MRGEDFDGTSFETLSGVLLLEELGCCALAAGTEALRNSDAVRHRGKNAECRRNDLAGEDTIRVRRSHEV
jgi:hypothetical protein